MRQSFARLLILTVFVAIACVVPRDPGGGGSSDDNTSDASSQSQPVGAPCTSDSDCAFILGKAHCLTEAEAASFGQGAPGGYCTSTTCTVSAPATSCGPKTICGNLVSSGAGTDSFCESVCSTQAECRTGYDCASGGCVLGPPIPDGGNVNHDGGMNMQGSDGGMNMQGNDGGMNMQGDDGGMNMNFDAGCSGPTTISGIVHAPTLPTLETPDPINGATVYVPQSQVAQFAGGVSCEACGAPLSGNPLVQFTTGPDGKFQLTVPPGSRIPLVVQIGRWRRQILIPTVTACVDNPISDDLTRLPRTHLEGDIPLIAMVTGEADPLECDLLKFGIDPSEFVNPGGTTGGRVEVYSNGGGGNPLLGGGGATINTSTPDMSVLIGNETTLKKYDLVLFGCPGQEVDQDAGPDTNIADYANAGGRMLAIHYNFTFLDNAEAWQSTATWSPDLGTSSSAMTFSVDESTTSGMNMATWLHNAGASPTTGEVVIDDTREDFTAVTSPAQELLFDSTQPLAYTFQTPWDKVGVPACGRVTFADFHTGLTPTSSLTFPTECPTATPMTPEEKTLEYLLFDLGSCINQ